jgi:hypothetical protein
MVCIFWDHRGRDHMIMYINIYQSKSVPITINVAKCMHVHDEENRIQVEFEDTKGGIRIHRLKKNRQHNGQKKKL